MFLMPKMKAVPCSSISMAGYLVVFCRNLLRLLNWGYEMSSTEFNTAKPVYLPTE